MSFARSLISRLSRSISRNIGALRRRKNGTRVRNEPSDIRPGTVGETKAEIAKQLIAKDPDLAGRKDDLMDAINRHYKEHHAVKVSLTDEDIENVVKRQMPAPAVGAACDLILPLPSAKE